MSDFDAQLGDGELEDSRMEMWEMGGDDRADVADEFFGVAEDAILESNLERDSELPDWEGDLIQEDYEPSPYDGTYSEE